MSQQPRPLADLPLSALKEHPVWRETGDWTDDGSQFVEPVTFDSHDLVPHTSGLVWCLCTATTASGRQFDAISFVDSNKSGGPLLWTFFVGNEVVGLYLPPAPDFVLEKDGPVKFAERICEAPDRVFPIRMMALARFECPPTLRWTILDVTGIVAQSR